MSRDHRPDRLQIVYGLLCDRDGRPIAIEVCKPAPAKAGGDTADPSTLPAPVAKLKRRFGLRHLVLVGDRGMITAARLREDLKPAGLDWITSLRAPQIQALAEAGRLQLSLFDERNPGSSPGQVPPRSPAPTIQANASSFAAIPIWPANVPANARICCLPPNATCHASPPRCAGAIPRCTARQRSGSPWGR